MKIIVVFIFLLLVILCYIILRNEEKFFKDMYQIAIQTKSIIKETNEMEENEKMNVYIVVCNGKVSSEAYRTLEEAQKFCETRNEIKQKIGNGWRYEGEYNSYVIQEVRVEK